MLHDGFENPLHLSRPLFAAFFNQRFRRLLHFSRTSSGNFFGGGLWGRHIFEYQFGCLFLGLARSESCRIWQIQSCKLAIEELHEELCISPNSAFFTIVQDCILKHKPNILSTLKWGRICVGLQSGADGAQVHRFLDNFLVVSKAQGNVVHRLQECFCICMTEQGFNQLLKWPLPIHRFLRQRRDSGNRLGFRLFFALLRSCQILGLRFVCLGLYGFQELLPFIFKEIFQLACKLVDFISLSVIQQGVIEDENHVRIELLLNLLVTVAIEFRLDCAQIHWLLDYLVVVFQPQFLCINRLLERPSMLVPEDLVEGADTGNYPASLLLPNKLDSISFGIRFFGFVFSSLLLWLCFSLGLRHCFFRHRILFYWRAFSTAGRLLFVRLSFC
mmetsp:Transcript_8547/g.13482  ORF Transcript_8547/g.13482 Transcript_8547/m.13482 type:complete len:387 (+) Transcript_8547:1472-2632(+)